MRTYRFRIGGTTCITKGSKGVQRYAMARNTVTEDDEGKHVVDAHGETIGMVSEVRNGTAYVNADPGITDSIRSKLGWGDADKDDYALERSRIDTVTDDEIRLNSNL
jgi:hypothetical protein